MLARAGPTPLVAVDGNSLTIQLSPSVTSKPAAAIRRRASTPASYQVELFAETQERQPPVLISARGWKFGPSARIRQAWSVRNAVLSAASGGIEM